MTSTGASAKRRALANSNSSSQTSQKSQKTKAGVQRSKRGGKTVDYDESKMYGGKEEFGGVMKIVRYGNEWE